MLYYLERTRVVRISILCGRESVLYNKLDNGGVGLTEKYLDFLKKS